MRDVALILPIKGFSGMTRLMPSLGADARARLARELADRAVRAGLGAGITTFVVTAADDVIVWAGEHGASVIEDPRGGLNAAAAAGVLGAGSARWILAHADLPFVDPESIAHIAHRSVNQTVLVPSIDGGTNVVASAGVFRFAFGPDSFHRHLAECPDAEVIALPQLSIDIDTPRHLHAVRRLTALSSLAP